MESDGKPTSRCHRHIPLNRHLGGHLDGGGDGSGSVVGGGCSIEGGMVG